MSMCYNQFLSQLAVYMPTDKSEQIFKKDILSFAQKTPDCFERSCQSGHITGSSWLLNKAGTHVLLMHHKKLDIWVQLGGHCDGETDVLAVAVKEAQEESGIMGIEPVSKEIFDVDVHLIPANSKEPAHYHYDIRFLLQVVSDEEIVQNSESKELRWIAKNATQLPTQERSVMRMFEKWRRLK